MKTLLVALIFLPLVALGGSVTITTTSSEDALIAPAMGAYLGLPGPATQAQVKQAIIQWVVGITLDYQRRQNMQTYTPVPILPQ